MQFVLLLLPLLRPDEKGIKSLLLLASIFFVVVPSQGYWLARGLTLGGSSCLLLSAGAVAVAGAGGGVASSPAIRIVATLATCHAQEEEGRPAKSSAAASQLENLREHRAVKETELARQRTGDWQAGRKESEREGANQEESVAKHKNEAQEEAAVVER